MYRKSRNCGSRRIAAHSGLRIQAAGGGSETRWRQSALLAGSGMNVRENAEITFVGDLGRPLAIARQIRRGPRAETVHGTVVHAKHGGDQDRVVDLKVRGALLPGPFDGVWQ